MLVSHEVPRTLLDFSLLFNDYDYFLIHQLIKYKEYRDFYKLSKLLGRRQILDNSLYELGESFDPKGYAKMISELKPAEYLIPDCFNDYSKNIKMFNTWMDKYGALPGIKIATVHGETLNEFQKAYDYFCKADPNIKIAFNFAESLYDTNGGRVNVIKNVNIDVTRKHHLLGCKTPAEFMAFSDCDWVETIDTSNPVMCAFEKSRYPTGIKPQLKVDDVQDTLITADLKFSILTNTTIFKQLIRK